MKIISDQPGAAACLQMEMANQNAGVDSLRYFYAIFFYVRY